MRKKKNLKRKQAKKANQIEVDQSNLHKIDEMQTFYIKNWDIQDNFKQLKANPEISVQFTKKKLAQNVSQQLDKKPAYSGSLPRLKPFAFSHSKLQLIWKPKESVSQRLLPQPKQKSERKSLKLKPKQQNTLFASRLNLQPIEPFLYNNKNQQNSSTGRDVEKKINKLLYPRNRTEVESRMEIKFKEFKIDTKNNEIGYILKKHKNNYKSQIIHQIIKEESNLNVSSKIVPTYFEKLNQSSLISESLKYYSSMRQYQQKIS